MLFSGKIQPKLASKSDVYIMAHGKMSAALFPLLLSSSSSSPRDECMRLCVEKERPPENILIWYYSIRATTDFINLQTSMMFVIQPHSFKGGRKPIT